METGFSIVTVGFCPAWDITCSGNELGWGRHRILSSCSEQPAGKSLNISRALAWMGQKSIASGLWGSKDAESMLKAMEPLSRSVKIKMTTTAGATRRNITVVDTARNKEMHLRSKSGLASKKTLGKLRTCLEAIVGKDSVCVFAGSMPEKEFLPDVAEIMDFCRSRRAKIVLDTSGSALREIVDSGGFWLIKPNVEELNELLGERVRDTVGSLAKAGRRLLGKVEIVLISRGRKGAVVVTPQGAWEGKCVNVSPKILSTVGCGDYLLAGFLKGLKEDFDVASALGIALKAATAKAYGWAFQMQWPQAKRRIQVKVIPLRVVNFRE